MEWQLLHRACGGFFRCEPVTANAHNTRHNFISMAKLCLVHVKSGSIFGRWRCSLSMTYAVNIVLGHIQNRSSWFNLALSPRTSSLCRKKRVVRRSQMGIHSNSTTSSEISSGDSPEFHNCCEFCFTSWWCCLHVYPMYHGARNSGCLRAINHV